MAIRSKNSWQPTGSPRWLLWALVVSLIALIVWGALRWNGNAATSTPVPSVSASSSSATPNPVQSSADLPAETLRATAEQVLHAYYDSPTVNSTPVDLGQFASPETVNLIKEQWLGAPSDMSERITSVDYPNAPTQQDDGTVTLDARVELRIDYGDSNVEESIVTPILHFSLQNGKWIVYTIEEIDGDATGAGE
ncbi:MAG: hypothetical protein ABIP74_04455 [Candidatus Saccharimonas sp.]